MRQDPYLPRLSAVDQTLHSWLNKNWLKLHYRSRWRKKINVWPLDLLSGSVQDLFDAPAAQEEIQALLNRLDKTVGEISTQEVLAPSKTHSHVPKVLSQSRGGHGLGKRTLRMHGSEREQQAETMRRAVCRGEMAGESDQTGLLQQLEVCSVF